MDLLQNIYHQSLQGNEKNLKFWEDYLSNLKSLDFSVYSEQLKVPILVPIGSRILFRGELKHTNEVTVSLGADYFAKCSIAQAEILRKHRIKDAESKVEMFQKEREFLQHHMSFSKEQVFQQEGQEIIEHYTAEEDDEWRRQHRERVRKHKQSKPDKEVAQDIDDEELWNRLEELELQEELENELSNNAEEPNNTNTDPVTLNQEENHIVTNETHAIETREVNEHEATRLHRDNSKESKQNNTEILQKILEKQTELEQKISDLKYRDRSATKTEEDLYKRLDEMEQLDELEDEMDRVDDVLENQDIESSSQSENEDIQQPLPKVKRSVSFADDDDEPECLEVTFSHSQVQPDETPYDPKKGICKPSDIYEAYKPLFANETTSILKRTNQVDQNNVSIENVNHTRQKPNGIRFREDSEPEVTENRSIVVKDVMEKQTTEVGASDVSERPTSLFKQRRQQRKL